MAVFLVNSMEKLNWIIKTSKLQMKTTTNNYAYLCSFNWSLFHSICFILGLFSFFSAIYNVIGALNDRSWESNEPILWFSIWKTQKYPQWFFKSSHRYFPYTYIVHKSIVSFHVNKFHCLHRHFMCIFLLYDQQTVTKCTFNSISI